jgi:hypothetical protein
MRQSNIKAENVKAKAGYKKQKPESSIGKWLKRYFEKRTCRKRIGVDVDAA